MIMHIYAPKLSMSIFHPIKKRMPSVEGTVYYIADRAHLNTLITTTRESTAKPIELTVVTPSVMVPTTDVTSIVAALALLISAADTATPNPYFFTADGNPFLFNLLFCPI